MGKKKTQKNRKIKEKDTMGRGDSDLQIGWKDWKFLIKSGRLPKHGRGFLYAAAVLDLAGVIILFVSSIKNTYWLYVVITFAILLLLSLAFIIGVIMVALYTDT